LEFETVYSKFPLPNYYSTTESILNQVKPAPKEDNEIHLSVVGKYFIPLSRNYEAIDMLLFRDFSTLLFPKSPFQNTIGLNHISYKEEAA